MSDLQPDSTRVFVKGLPSSYTSAQLADHFRKQYTVTDAHVFPERRIGFVGFHDANSAKSAVKYFNRSYIRMSKILVDLAKPVEVKHDASGQAVPVSKRVASHPTRLRETRNEHDVGKRKRDIKDDGEVERAENDQSGTPPENQNEQMTTGVEEEDAEPHADVPASDSDWLRAKTSRTLDLVEPEETRNSEIGTSDEVQAESETLTLQASDPKQSPSEPSDGKNGAKVPNGRLFVRNLAFDVTDADLEAKFGQFGKLQEAHVVQDARTQTSKGLAFLQFSEPEEAVHAIQSLDGVSFHGRLLHILPASDKRDQGLTEFDISQMPLKKQKALKRKLGTASSAFSWNSLYMNPDAVISSIADRLGLSKSDILDPTSADAAVKQAHAETQLIAETKDYLRTRGVDIDAFKNKRRDDRVLLLKNFPFGTSEADLRTLLEPFGQVSNFILPPAGTMALVQFAESYSASQAFRQLAYKNIKGSVLYLEKAPQGLLDRKLANAAHDQSNIDAKVVEEDAGREPASAADAATVFVRNLNFSTTSSQLTEVFGALPGFMSARVKTKIDPKRPNEVLSMGFGFIEFKNRSYADTAISALNGHKLHGHELIVRLSIKGSDVAEERRKEDNAKKLEANKTKIIIKNLPFETSKKDVRSLFKQYGQLKKVRVPKKFDNTSRGFGFAEFVTSKEAQNAMDALSDTHLLGRRLVLEFTEEEDIDPEEQIQNMERKTELQNSRIQNSKLAGTGRKKFVLEAAADD